MNPMVGEKFGKMKVIGDAQSINGRKWPAQCDCGSRPRTVSITQLKRWLKTGTGCRSCMIRIKHGHGTTKDRTYGSWYSMKRRCYYQTAKNYQWYGAKGVSVCDRWIKSFSAFLEDMGIRPAGCTIDRIDPEGNYEPSNCKWSTTSEQRNNQRAGK